MSLIQWFSNRKSKNTSKIEALIGEWNLLLDCEIVHIHGEKNHAAVIKRYREMLAEGRVQGYTPLLIDPSENLVEALKMFEEEADGPLPPYREAMAQRVQTADAKAVLDKLAAEYDATMMELLETTESDVKITQTGTKPANISGLTIVLTGRLLPDLLIAKIPTRNPWELPLWVTMGGFNDCPDAEAQAVIFRHWYEKYGAVPICVSDCTWELYLERPIENVADALKIAKEQYLFDYDIVEQGAGGVAELADELLYNPIWYFWWD